MAPAGGLGTNDHWTSRLLRKNYDDMTSPAPPDRTDLFDDTAYWYARYRLPYPQEVLDLLVRKFHLDGSSRVLDFGCGTGQIALPLSARVQEVVGVDISQEMIEEARRQAQEQGAKNIRWMVLAGEEVPPTLGRFQLATFGASFHWMNQPAVLDRCAEVIGPGSGIAIMGMSTFWNYQDDWARAIVSVVQRYLGQERRAGSGSFPNHRPFEDYIAESSFGNLERGDYRFRHEWDIPSIIGHLYSTSYCKRAMLGDQVQAFEKDLTETLLKLNPEGHFPQEVPGDYLFAWTQ